MNVHEHRPAASAHSNGDFILVESYSGLGRMQLDSEAPQFHLPMGSADLDAGRAVLEALSNSRQISMDEIPQFFDLDRTNRVYKEWILDLIVRYGYKTKRALFKDMKSVSIRLNPSQTIMTLAPSHHDRLESWIRTKSDGIEDVVVPADSSPAEIGAALRLAFSRCT